MELYETDDELDDDIVNESLLANNKCQPMYVLPLYSLLSSEKQAKVIYLFVFRINLIRIRFQTGCVSCNRFQMPIS